MPRIRLLHWKEEECAPRGEALRRLGYEVDAAHFAGSSMIEFRANPPDAVVIDLSRLPSHGREVGVYLRQRKATRLIPLVYVEGDPAKVAGVKATLPDARYTTYAKIGPVLEDVLANPPREVFVPKPLSGPGSPVPLVKKLGIKEGQSVGLFHAPDGFEALIPGADCQRNPPGKVPLSIWFVTTPRGLKAALPEMRRRAEDGGLWVIWQKRTPAVTPLINGNEIRAAALAAGLVDFKICAVDHTWSGMRFAVKR